MQPLVYLQLGSLMTDFIVPMDLKATNEVKRYAVWSVEAALCACVHTYVNPFKYIFAFFVTSLPQNIHKLYRHDCLKKEHVSAMIRVSIKVPLC